jgi:methionine synthase II (cobalamin-independent)
MSYHADIVGSYLRPAHLLDARNKKEKNEINAEELRKIEDEAIKVLVEKEIATGVKVVTDGEYRRNDFFTDFLVGLNGVRIGSTTVYKDAFSIPKYEEEGWKLPRELWDSVRVPYADGKVSANPNHPEYSYFEFLKSVTPTGFIPKIVVPSPIYLTTFRAKDDPFPKNAYSNVDDYYNDISLAYKETFLTFYKKGVRV